MTRDEAVDKFPLPAFSKWVEKSQPLHWAIVCHQCKTVSHIAKDFKDGRCSDCGVCVSRPARESKLKSKKRAGFV